MKASWLSGQRLNVEQSADVLTVTFDRPPRHFFDERMSIELDALTRALRRDSSVRVVIFLGAEDTFITHFDVPSLVAGAAVAPFPISYRQARAVTAFARLLARSQTADRWLRRTALREALFLARTYAAINRLSRLEQVVIAEINGLALGMGSIFALSCDIRTMADDTEFGFVESGIGVLAGATGTQRLVRTVGIGRAIELLLEGRIFGADDAARIGLVHHVFPRAQLHERTLEIARRLAHRNAPITREIKRAVYETATKSAPRSLGAEAAGFLRALASRETREPLSRYATYLQTHTPLSDEVILRGWEPLLDPSVDTTSTFFGGES